MFSPRPSSSIVSVNNAVHHLIRRGRSMRMTCRASNGVTMNSRRMAEFVRFVGNFGRLFTSSGSDMVASGCGRVGAFFTGGGRDSFSAESVLAVGNLVHHNRTHATYACGRVPLSRIRFLSLPFCRDKGVRGLPVARGSIRVIETLLRRIGPRRVCMTNSLTSPRKARGGYASTILTTVSRRGGTNTR